MRPRTLFQKIWDEHVVVPESEGAPAVLYVDLHLIHEVTSPQAFDTLRARNLKVRRPDRVLATMDHSTPTGPGPQDEQAVRQVETLARNCREHGIELHDMDSEHRGIVHVIGPELGATQPGRVIVCGDSHTSTHGAFGALAFGIGSTEVGHVLATQCLLQRRPKTMAVHLKGSLPTGVSAKDVILAIIGEIGVDGGTGHVIEYRGEAIESMSMEQRMTICNMSIEAGARAGMIAPDQTTIDDLRDRPMSPTGKDWDLAVDRWRQLPTDDGAIYDAEFTIDISSLEPMITFGTNPGMVMGIGSTVPVSDAPAFLKGLEYMGVEPGEPLLGKPIDVVFIGSCTNARLSDLRQAAEVMEGKHVATGVRALVVPGSQQVKRAAEAEGLHEVFTRAGADWRESGCSMCIAMNGDRVERGQYAVSTSNRNFAGRQGAGSRTFLASPATAAAAAIAGRVVDPREVLAEGRER